MKINPGVSEINHGSLGGGAKESRQPMIGARMRIINLTAVGKNSINEIIFVLIKLLVLCGIFPKLAKYLYVHNHSTNIFTIFIRLSIFSGPLSNNMSIAVCISNLNAIKNNDLDLHDANKKVRLTC